MTYTIGIPAANNNPSSDQPLMRDNFTAINNLIDIDHVTFNNTDQGEHKQVTFNANHVPGVSPTDPSSILYTNVGSASTVAELYYRNQNAILPVTAIRAFGRFYTVTVSPPTITNGFNIASITGSSGFSGSNYVITLNANTTSSNEVIVLAYSGTNTGNGLNYTFVSNVLTLTNAQSIAGIPFNFVIIQI